MSKKEIIKSTDPSRELVKAIAIDIGKEVVSHAKNMYPAAFAAVPSTFEISLRNGIYNQIMAALDITDEETIISRLSERKAFRRKINAFYKKDMQTRRKCDG